MADLQTLEAQMDAAGVAPELRPRWRETFARQNGISLAPTAEELARTEKDARILEAAEQKKITEILVSHGFKVRSTSQYRAAKVSPGLPDLIAHHKTLPIFLFWESKRQVGGVMSEVQKEFAEDCKRTETRCYSGDRYDCWRVMKELGVTET